jgi:hypothetical protein
MPILDLEYDLENVSSEFEALPAGQYLAKITEAELTKTQSTNRNMIKVTWEITEGDFEGRKLFDNIVLIEAAAFKMKQYAELIGVESGSQIDTADFVEAEALLTVIQGEYNGEPNNSIKKVKPAS